MLVVFFRCGLWYKVFKMKMLFIIDNMISVIEVMDLKMISLEFFGGRVGEVIIFV